MIYSSDYGDIPKPTMPSPNDVPTPSRPPFDNPDQPPVDTPVDTPSDTPNPPEPIKVPDLPGENDPREAPGREQPTENDDLPDMPGREDRGT